MEQEHGPVLIEPIRENYPRANRAVGPVEDDRASPAKMLTQHLELIVSLVAPPARMEQRSISGYARRIAGNQDHLKAVAPRCGVDSG